MSAIHDEDPSAMSDLSGVLLAISCLWALGWAAWWALN